VVVKVVASVTGFTWQSRTAEAPNTYQQVEAPLLKYRSKGVAVAATMTMWVNTISGELLSREALDELRAKAHRTYEANVHIFEDEYEALTALGAVPLRRRNGFAPWDLDEVLPLDAA
jgi:hypothetical protein